MAFAMQIPQPYAPPWPPFPTELTLGPAEVHVVCASVDLSGQRLRDLAATLSQDELERAGRFHFHRDRDRFIARRGLLRELLGLHLQTAPRRLVFSAGPFGKPALAKPPEDRPLHFSLAHSNDLAVFAVSREAAVGVDVELVRELPDLAGLVSTVLSGREQLQWQSLPEPQRLRVFFDVWTRKEAFLKGTGQGLQKPPQEIEVPLCRCEQDQRLPVFDGGRQVTDWSLRSFSAGSFALALALRRPPTRVCCWEWSSSSQPHRLPQGG
jgi:4'-phosphopantetheinyl transferase